MIQYVNDDLLNTNCKMIAHGCNDKGQMGSGVAGPIRERYPKAYKVYKEVSNSSGLELGQVIFVLTEDKIIANCITQSGYSHDGRQYVDYEALRTCMDRIEREVTSNSRLSNEIAMPMIGSGLGGGNWSIISEIIEDKLVETTCYVYYL